MHYNYPDLQIEGDEYPAHPTKKAIASVLQYAQYALMIVIFAGDWIFMKLSVVPPALYYRMKENKVIAFFAVLILGNNLINMLLQTGAFEIYFDGKVIFSKLQMERMPTIKEIEDRMLAKING